MGNRRASDAEGIIPTTLEGLLEGTKKLCDVWEDPV
jgi:hypothetical protein